RGAPPGASRRRRNAPRPAGTAGPPAAAPPRRNTWLPSPSTRLYTHEKLPERSLSHPSPPTARALCSLPPYLASREAPDDTTARSLGSSRRDRDARSLVDRLGAGA